MLDRPWVRLVVGALAAALLGAMAARVALSSAGDGPGAGAAVAGAPARAPGGGSGDGRAGGASGGSAPDGAGPAGGATASLPSGTGRVTVHVTGAVRRPGVYMLAEGARVDEAVRRAGGATAAGDRQGLNLAAAVRDGQQVRVPPRVAPAASPGSGGPSADAGAGGPVDLNTASVEELQTLDGVGEATAAKIVRLREERGGIGGVDDLDEIPGIGAKKLEALRAQLQP